MTIRKASPDDIIRWPDGTTCSRGELSGFGHMGDDYEVICEDSPEYEILHRQNAEVERLGCPVRKTGPYAVPAARQPVAEGERSLDTGEGDAWLP